MFLAFKDIRPRHLQRVLKKLSGKKRRAYRMESPQESCQLSPLIGLLACQDGIIPDSGVNSGDWVLSSIAGLVLKEGHLAHPHQSQGLINIWLQQCDSL